MIPPVIGVSKGIQRVRDLIDHVADTGLNIVICGESGVGKEVVAQNLYQKSPRRGKPFVKINCAALPEGLLESELFGHEQGSFTGAQRRKRGKFELANEGVLLLDEIGDMSLPLQSKLLHVLQSGEFSPVGAEKDIRTDAWIIAATNHELEEDIRSGRFREDLYYRLNIIRIYISPLRSRPEDIRPLIEFYLKAYAGRYHHSDIGPVNDQFYGRLESYDWPGNVRELQNVLKRMLVLGNSEEILDELLNGRSPQRWSDPPASPDAGPLRWHSLLKLDPDGQPDIKDINLKRIKKQAVNQVEREVISYVLAHTGWNRSKASRILGISYKTLLYKIEELKILPPKPSRKRMSRNNPLGAL
jgi:two-component system response regulator AtoC